MRGVLGLLVASAALSCAARPTTTVAVPAATSPGDVALADDCLACHSDDLLRQQRLTDKQWAKTLDKMRTWGAPTGDEDAAALLATLVAHAGADPGTARAISPREAAALFAGTKDGLWGGGDAGRGRPLYADGCAPCHGEKGEGADMGVALAGRHVLDRAPDVASVVRMGRGRMPQFAETTDAEIADMLAFLRSLPAP